MTVILNSLRTLITIKQKDFQSLQNYSKQFQISREVFESHVSRPFIISKILLTIERYTKCATNPIDHKKNKNLQDQIFKQLFAYTYLENADQLKYGLILYGLITQKFLEINQYPKIINEANNGFKTTSLN